jgi:predicted dehydrogenase
VKVAVIGTGFGARVVAPAYHDADIDVVAVVSARDRAEAAACIARADVDLVSVHAPPFLHAWYVHDAIAHGKAVLCDKPFALSPPEGADLLAAAEAAGVAHFVNFEFRFHPVRQRVRDLAHRGELGAIEHISWTHLSAGSRVPLRPYGWLFDKSQGGGWVGAWASHAVDTLRWMFGEVSDASGTVRTDITRRPDRDGQERECSAEDGMEAHLVLASGVTVALDSTFAASASVPPRFIVIGSEGVLEVVGDAKLTIRRPEGTREDIDLGSTPAIDRHDEPMRRFAAVVRDVLDGTPHDDVPTFADGVACDEVLARLK